jgi:DNA (cytosine-5)-methyltransferase 1
MNDGQVFKMVKNAFHSTMPVVKGWLLSTDKYAVPQRRKRVFLIGNKDENFDIESPERITDTKQKKDLFEDLHNSISVKEALSDLPALKPGEDGSHYPYVSEPKTTYQAFMRGIISPKEYIQKIKNGDRYFKSSTKTRV